MKHLWDVAAVGWGEPLEFYPSCTCGWTGITVHEQWWPEGDTGYSLFIQPLREVARKWEPEQVALASNAVFGTREDAIVQALHHVGYSPKEELSNAFTLYDQAAASFRNGVYWGNGGEESLRILNVAAKNLALAKDYEKIMADRAVPQLPRPIAEAQEAIRKGLGK